MNEVNASRISPKRFITNDVFVILRYNREMHKKNNDLKPIAKILQSHPFVVPKVLQNPYLQTISVFAPLPAFTIKMPKSERRYIDLPDGTKLGCDIWLQKDKEEHATVVLLSGLEGYNLSERSRFISEMANKAYSYGYNVIHLKQRGESDTIHLTKSIFAADPVEDLTIALEQFIQLGCKKMYLVGVSGGGWAALFTLAKVKKDVGQYIAGAVAISPPRNLIDTWIHAEKSRISRWMLFQSYKNLVQRRIKLDGPSAWDLRASNSAKTLREWAENFFPYSFGFKEKFLTIEGYHKQTDLAFYFSKMQAPVLLIHSQDDPIIPITPFIQSSLDQYSNIIPLFTKYGGHGGFLTAKKRYGDLDRHWAQNRAMEFIRLLDEA